MTASHALGAGPATLDGVLADSRRRRYRRLPATAAVLVLGRSIPTLVWGILFVAAVGFGPLPGALALACHSTGMLGKFCGEILEHVDPAPGDALRSRGVSCLGVLRFSV